MPHQYGAAPPHQSRRHLPVRPSHKDGPPFSHAPHAHLDPFSH
jgi:hypothetical protein